MSAIALRGLLFALVWWTLAEGRVDSWGVGLVFVALAVLASLRLSPSGRGRVSLPGLLDFAAFFGAVGARRLSGRRHGDAAAARHRPRPV